MIKIEVNCKGTNYIGLSELNILQDTEKFQLKELSKENFEKLKNRIEKKGFGSRFLFGIAKPIKNGITQMERSDIKC